MMGSTGVSKVGSPSPAKGRAQRRHLMFGLLAGIGLGLIGYWGVVLWIGVDESDSDTPLITIADTLSEKTASSDGQLYSNQLSAEMVNYIDELSLEQLTVLVDDITQLDSTTSLTSVQMFLIGRLTKQEPQAGLELVWKFPRNQWSELVTVVFSEWSIMDLEDALSASLELRSSLQDTALRSLITTRTDITNDRWLALGIEYDLDETVRSLLREQEAMTLLASPLDAIRLLREDDVPDELQYDLRKKFAKTAIQRKGIAALKSIIEMLAENSRFVQLDFIEEEISALPPAEVVALFQDFPSELRRNTTHGMIKSWVSASPEIAYQELSSLSEFRKSSWTFPVFSSWAEVDTEGLLDRIESFPRSERGYAASVGIGELVKKSPAEAASRIAELDNILGVEVSDLQGTLVEYWRKIDPAATLQWITENTEEGGWNQANLLWKLLWDYVEKDPAKALDIALSQSPTSVYAERGSVRDIITKLTEAGEFELAMGALDRIPDAARSESYTAVGRVLVEKDQWQEAIDLVAEFSEEDQFQHFRGLTFWAIRNDLEKMLDTIPGIPSEKTRGQIAQAAIANHERYGNMLTENQIKFLEQYIVRP
ncbi:MAG: hypothetical protein F4039_03750 [Gammaproteobacteria bacterium]|nr:hypothetical protein [Gammaproteobacteria bacterium]MYF52945.1 hypothetical protein [Gammaproteobacteria bacterium]MYK43187.1 hypothetical protein [Gammaproteobacteria bacterium]